MGVCLSRCGDQHDANYIDSVETKKTTTTTYDPNHSFKRFLHLNIMQSEPGPSPRTSVTIPPSSELFSLPVSELELASDGTSTGFSSRKKKTKKKKKKKRIQPLPQSSRDMAFGKHMPVENSVTDFLRTVETFVSLIEAPRSTVADRRLASNRVEDPADSDEMFTFDSKASPRQNQSPVSLQRLLTRTNSQEAPDAAQNTEWTSPIELQSGTTGSAPDTDMEAEEGDAVGAARPALDRNVMAMRKSKSPRFPLRMGALRRGRLSRSLDSMESSVIQEFDIRNDILKPIAAGNGSKHLTEAATLIDAKRTKFELLPVPNTWSCKSGCEQKKSEENCCSGFLDTSTTAELATSEILPPQEVASLVEDAVAVTGSAECSPREPADKGPEMKKIRSEEAECTELEPPPIVSTNDSSSSDSTQAEGEDCQRLGSLLEAFHSLLKLPYSPTRSQLVLHVQTQMRKISMEFSHGDSQ